MKIKNFLKLIIPGIVLISSCVPAKQFESMQDNFKKCDEERSILTAKNEVLHVENTELNSRVKFLEEKLEVLVNDSIAKSEEIRYLSEKMDDMKTRYAEIQEAQESLIQGNAQETKRLLKELQRTQSDLQTREDRLRDLEVQLNQKRASLEKLQAELEQRNARLIELEQILHAKDSVVNALKNKVQNALLGFEEMGLSIQLKNGKVYVSLAEKLLFKSGSTDVDPKGQEALRELAAVLAQNPDINIMVEGHTDDVPVISGASIKDNWDLSVKRATSIVRILLENSGIDPTRITAAGRGEYLPINPEKTPEARSKNRRTEIILTPKLDELFEILE